MGEGRKQRREVACDEDLNRSFKQGLALQGLKEHSLSRKMQLLRNLQEKVLLFTEEVIVNEETTPPEEIER